MDVYYRRRAHRPHGAAHAEDLPVSNAGSGTTFQRIPLIVYASHQHFDRRTCSRPHSGWRPGLHRVPERRVALPFRGDYAQFRHTLRHELVHAFQISKIAEVRSLHPGRERFTPQDVHWWTEGLAEYWSSEQEPEDELFNRDLVLSGAVPSIRSMTRQQSFASYPLGAELHRYLARRFGEDYIVRFYEEFWRYDSFENALAGVLGVDLDSLDLEWRRALQRDASPAGGARRPTSPPCPRLRAGRQLAMKMVDPDDGVGHLFFLSARTGYTSIYRTTIEAGEHGVSRVVEGEKTAEFESFHPFDSRIDVHESGALTFVSKYLQRDALFIWDLHEGRAVGRYQWPDLVGLRSPAWSPDGRRIVFEGLSTSGDSDLYVLDFRTQQRIRPTADAYRDRDPDWSPDGRSIVFASDRTPYGADGHVNLFILELADGSVRPLTHGPWRDLSPRWSHDGSRIAFTSDRDGTPDLYVVDIRGDGRRLTSLAGGAFDPVWLPDDRGLVFAGYVEGTYRIYRLAFGEDTLYMPRIALGQAPLPDSSPAGHDTATAGPPTGAASALGWHWLERDADRRAHDHSTRPFVYHNSGGGIRPNGKFFNLGNKSY